MASSGNVVAKKVGPVGGPGGENSYDVTGITRIVKVSVQHGDSIRALTVTFIRNGREENGGRWGAAGDTMSEFTLQPSEYIKSIKGYVGMSYGYKVVKSLKFETNFKTYGPYGVEQGDTFEFPVGNGQIVGFHGRCGGLLDSIGVYVKEEPIGSGNGATNGNGATKKVGPVGGPGGENSYDVSGITRIVKISVQHGDSIRALTVTFIRNGREENGGRWGAAGDTMSEFTLQPSEYIKSIKGHIGMSYGYKVVKSLKFETNFKTYGPYGVEQGDTFEVPVGDGQIVGFHGRCGGLLDSFGVYIKEGLTQVITKKVGPCGGAGGQVKDMNVDGITRILRISVRHGSAIDGFAVRFLRNGREESSEMGGQGGKLTEVDLQPNEYITSVKGHFGNISGMLLVRSLKFETNLGSYGPYGTEDGAPFELPAIEGQIIGFHGRAGMLLDAFGVYIKVDSGTPAARRTTKRDLPMM